MTNEELMRRLILDLKGYGKPLDLILAFADEIRQECGKLGRDFHEANDGMTDMTHDEYGKALEAAIMSTKGAEG